jgi:hypothetical protein
MATGRRSHFEEQRAAGSHGLTAFVRSVTAKRSRFPFGIPSASLCRESAESAAPDRSLHRTAESGSDRPMNDSDRQQILDAARALLAQVLPDAWAIYVYGTFARGDEEPGSDLDLAVLLPPQP